jgi:hypothetical protein
MRIAPKKYAAARAPLCGALLGLLVALLLVTGHQRVGYVRDEGIYFVASRSYAAWAAQALRRPASVLDAPARDRAFAVNNEHPPLMKLLAGLSARLLTAAPAPTNPSTTPPSRADPGGSTIPPVELAPAGLLPSLPEGAAMRLPAQLLAGLGVALLFLAGAALGGGLLAGLLAAGWFIALPRVWFHAGLHCFDVPVACATLAVVLTYRRALVAPAWGLALGPALGLAIAIKHNALFIAPLLVAHYAICLITAPRPRPRRLWAPLWLLSVALLAPLTVYCLWPWLWSDPLPRLAEYFAFHADHSYYNTEYFGVNYNRPPLPIAYPFVLTWATVPSALLLLALAGLVLGLRRDLAALRLQRVHARDQPASAPIARRRRWGAPLAGVARHDGLLFALFALAPILIIAHPSVPIFGGTKHWLTAYPFLALAAAAAWGALWRHLPLPDPGRARRLLPALALVTLLGPALWSTLHAHPYQLSTYAPLLGGARGAAERGLLRGFWGHALDGFALSDLPPGPIDLHDLHELARQQYAREGRWPPGLTPAPTARARAALHFYERHTLSYELAQWSALGHTAPAALIELDDVPLAALYTAAP